MKRKKENLCARTDLLQRIHISDNLNHQKSKSSKNVTSSVFQFSEQKSYYATKKNVNTQRNVYFYLAFLISDITLKRATL